MTPTMAMPGNTAETYPVQFLGTGLADDGLVVERFRVRAYGDIVPSQAEALAAKGRRRRGVRFFLCPHMEEAAMAYADPAVPRQHDRKRVALLTAAHCSRRVHQLRQDRTPVGAQIARSLRRAASRRIATATPG